MKKTLAAVAVLGAFAGSALAADVTLYGRVDTGLLMTDKSGDFADSTDWGMKSGLSTGSRVGIKGTEQLTDSLSVGFVLEKGIKTDTGATGDTEKAFDRESIVYLTSDFGEVALGRTTTIFSDGGRYNVIAGTNNVFGTGSGVFSAVDLYGGSGGRMDNSISYRSPKFAGFQVTAQYGMGAEGKENHSTTDRMATLGVKYAEGALALSAGVLYQNWASFDGTAKDVDDGYMAGLGGSYDFGVAKVYADARYFDNQKDVGALSGKLETGEEVLPTAKGYGLALGASVPAAGGTFLIGAGYLDGEGQVKDSEGTWDIDVKGYEFGVQYNYQITKRTRLYTGAGYLVHEYENADGESMKDKTTRVMAGMAHYF